MVRPARSAENSYFDEQAPRRAQLSQRDCSSSIQNERSEPVVHEDGAAGLHVLGSAALFFGAAILVLAAIDATGELPFRMPRSWYAERSLWSGLAILSIVAGGYLLRRRAPSSDEWVPTREGVRFTSLKLYGRANCHLCEQAKLLLLKYARYLPELEEFDVDADHECADRFGNCVPVVELDGKIRFRGRVNEVLLRRLIEGALPQEAGPPPVQ